MLKTGHNVAEKFSAFPISRVEYLILWKYTRKSRKFTT